MTIAYKDGELLVQDDFADAARWHHEGLGTVTPLPGGGLRLHCLASRQGGPACMLFLRYDLPDGIAVSYDVLVHSQGGLIINYVALRGLRGEDPIREPHRLAPRDGAMRNYFALKWGLQSYHVSFSRYNDKGEHTNTSNWRRNPGMWMVGHGDDLVQETGRRHRIRLTKDAGFLQLFVDGRLAHAVCDRDAARHPIPDWGKFGFRLIGSDVKADFFDFRVHRIEPAPERFQNGEKTQ